VRSSIVSSSLLSGQSAFRSEKISGRRETYDVMLCSRDGSVRSEGGSASAVESFGPSFFGHRMLLLLLTNQAIILHVNSHTISLSECMADG
jgi:hypothetical protein